MWFNSDCITINFTFINMLLRWLQQLIDEHMTWWLMRIGLYKGLLRLESSMHTLFRFFWHKQWHGVQFSIFWTFSEVLINVIFALNTYNFCLILIVTHVCITFACFECEHYNNTLLKFSLKIWVWNILQCYIIALNKFQKHKVQCEILA
jgi:hypothetical protein